MGLPKDPEKSVVNKLGIENPLKIITDEPLKDAPDFKSYAIKLTELIVNSNPRFTAGIYDGWGTGKTTLMKMIQNELDTRYYKNVETIWFDSWRYEREEYSAMLPLLRSIILGLDNAIKIVKNTNYNKKKEVLEKVKKSFVKVLSAVVRNTKLNLKFKAADSAEVGAEFEIGKIIDDYKSDGSFIKDQKRVFLHQHVSDHIEQELWKIRHNDSGELAFDFRLIIFIDDLDRCTPEKALELLESIKTFFDIEEIIYVSLLLSDIGLK